MSPVTILEQLERALADLAGLDADTLTDDELHEITIGLQRARHRLAGAGAGCLARWDARRVWATDRSRSPAARLARDVNCAPATARVELRRARAVAVMPATATAVTAGRLSGDHVDLLARARGAAPGLFAAHEHVLVEECGRLRFRDACRAVDYWRLRAEPDGAEHDAARQRDGSQLHASPTLEGTVVLNGVLDPVAGDIVLRELNRLADQLRVADETAGVTRTLSQRLAAAMVEMATRSGAVPAGARRPRPLFSVQLGDDSFRHLCELAAGTVIAPGALVPYLSDAEMEVVLFDGPFTIISLSHRRNFTGAVRRAIQIRDRTCQHPAGCDTPAEACDVDHIIPVSLGGVTDQFNGRSQCPTHNRNTDYHDHDAQPPHPRRDITILDHIRARLRWQYLHEHPDDEDDPDLDDEARPATEPATAAIRPPAEHPDLDAPDLEDALGDVDRPDHGDDFPAAG